MDIANTAIWYVLKKKETVGVLSNRHRTDRPRKTTEADGRNIVRAVTPPPKKNSQSRHQNLYNPVGVYNHSFEEDSENRNSEAITQHANHSSAIKIRRPMKYRDEQQKFLEKVL